MNVSSLLIFNVEMIKMLRNIYMQLNYIRKKKKNNGLLVS